MKKDPGKPPGGWRRGGAQRPLLVRSGQIAAIRGIPAHQDSLSPNRHRDIANVDQLLDRVAFIRYLTGKPVGVKTAINTGIDKLRFSAPVLSGSRVRLKATIKDAREMPGALRISFAVRVEVEGGSKPALLANVNYLYYPV